MRRLQRNRVCYEIEVTWNKTFENQLVCNRKHKSLNPLVSELRFPLWGIYPQKILKGNV